MRNLLVAIDYSRNTPRVVKEAKRLAKEFRCPVWLVHIEDCSDEVGEKLEKAVDVQASRKKTEALAEKFREDGIEANAVTKCGPVVETLMGEIQRLDAAHIVAGTHGYGWLNQMLRGSVTTELVNQCAIPITLIPRL